MNDRELLELAAKAAGYDTSHPWNRERAELDPPVIGLCIDGVSTNWNPLTDDGDALRLAVKLNMHVHAEFDCGIGSCAEVLYFHGPEFDCNIVSEKGSDAPYAATRRAIVRAAAEIGRAMP